MLNVLILGPPQILLDQAPQPVSRRKSRALLYYLAGNDTALSREQLLPIFWPDMTRKAGLQNLRTTLYGLRKDLGETILAAEHTLTLIADTEVDARTFADRLAAGHQHPAQLQATLNLYRGEFLEGHSLPDAPKYENWVTAERERYRRMLIRGQAELGRLYESAKDYPAALEALERALQANPLQEDLQRRSLRLQYLAGDRTGAIRRYDRLRKMLDEELGVPPMAETRALYDAIIKGDLQVETSRGPLHIQAGAVARPRSTASPLPFIGRRGELQRLETGARGGTLVVVEGEAGIGKTRLVETYLQHQEALVLRGAARELERTLPYQPLIDALRSLTAQDDWPRLRAQLDLPGVWLEATARLLPELAVPAPVLSPTAGPSAVPPADESRLLEGISQFLAALARIQPTFLFLDDLHWADVSTLGALSYLSRRSEDTSLALVGAAQPVSKDSDLAKLYQALTREGRLQRVTLARLKPGDIDVLATELSPDQARPLSDWLQQNSEGNPYILAALVRELRETGLLRTDGSLKEGALSTSPVVPQRVFNLIQARLAPLSDAARRVLDTAVAIGRTFEFEVVAQAAGLSEAAALDALDELQAASLVSSLDDRLRYTFDHNLIMEVAYREVGEVRHRLLHRRVAEALEQIHQDNLPDFSGLLAFHFREGRASEKAAHYAFNAGQRAAQVGGWKEAVRFYEQALEGAPADLRLDICLALGDAQFQAGRFPLASESYRAAISAASDRGDARAADQARLHLARSLISQARFEEAVALARQISGSVIPQHALEAYVLWGTALSLEGADLSAAARHLETACALPEAQERPTQLAQIHFELGSLAAQQGDLEQAVGRYREALEVARQTEEEASIIWQVLALNNLGFHLHLLGDPEAQSLARAGMELARDRGLLGLQTFLHSTLGEIALAEGDLETAEAEFLAGLELATRLEIPERIAGLRANLGRVALARGERQEARAALSDALAQAEALGTHHLAIRIRLWLAPLLPPIRRRALLQAARELAGRNGRRGLLREIEKLSKQLD